MLMRNPETAGPVFDQADRGSAHSNPPSGGDVVSTPEAPELDTARRGEPPHQETRRQDAPIAAPPLPRTSGPAIRRLRGLAKGLATLIVALVAVLMALVTWEDYVTTPWTRDGRVRVQVASVAPQVSGQITRVDIVDNQHVHKGDVLYVIDPFDFKNALDQSRAQLVEKAADLQVKQVQARRRQALSDLAVTVEEKQL